MVTAVGIILGFILNFASVWVSSAFSKFRLRDISTAVGLIICVPLLIIVLYRILNCNYPREDANKYYQKTLKIFILGIMVVFAALFIALMESLWINVISNPA